MPDAAHVDHRGNPVESAVLTNRNRAKSSVDVWGDLHLRTVETLRRADL